MSRETKLWSQVILTAWQDIFEGKAKTAEDIHTAKQFLMSKDPTWTDWRNWVCSAAGFDGDALRERAIKHNEEESSMSNVTDDPDVRGCCATCGKSGWVRYRLRGRFLEADPLINALQTSSATGELICDYCKSLYKEVAEKKQTSVNFSSEKSV